jgi:peptidoglycan/xylan/chitin deacetylase (PgdA/CDA1 family)
VVSASQLPGAVAGRRRGDPVPVSITFDDDLRSHVDYAMPALLEHGLPAAFFLNGASLRESHVYWWDALQAAVDERRPELAELFGASLASGTIQSLGLHIESLRPDDRTALAHRLADIAGTDRVQAGLADADVRALDGAGFEIGFHTLRHDPLPPLDDRALAAALTEGRRHLAQLVDADLQLLAYPHGQADARVAEAARAAGYEIAFTTDERRISDNSDPLLLGRFTPSFVSARHFASQISKTLLACLARRGSRADGGR